MLRSRASDDEVSFFLRRWLGASRESEERLQQLESARKASASRVASLTRRDSDVTANLVEELRLHNEELAATCEELHRQADGLRDSCALLERERSRYLDLFARAPEAQVNTDLQGTIVEANHAAAALFSMSADNLRGRLLIGFVPRGDTRTFRDILHEAATAPSGAPARSFRVRVRPRGLPVFLCHGRVATLHGPTSGRLALSFSLRRDDAHGDGDHAYGTKDLGREVALEFRRTTTAIAEFARLLRDGSTAGDEDRRDAAAWIERSAQAQGSMLDALAELSALRDAGAFTPGSEHVDLDECVCTVAGALPPECAARVALLRSPSAAPSRVRAPAALLARAVELLVRRAVDGTPRDAAPVKLWTSRDGSDAVVHVHAPDGSAVPQGWAVLTAVAARIAERGGGRIALGDPAPSALLCLPVVA